MALPEVLHRAVFEQSRTAVAVMDSRGILAVWNSAFGALFRSIAGAGPDRLEGSFFDFLASREGLRLDYFATEILLGGRSEADVETRVFTADGTRRSLRLVLSLLAAPSAQAPVTGAIERYLLCAAEDVTERVLREKRLMDAKEEAEKATHTKSQFLANMSHEIRTPIQTILGVVELMQETALDTEQAEYVTQVRFSADVLLGLINDILDFSKIEAGKLDLETTNFDLRSCVRQSVDLLVLDAHRKGLEIVVDIGDELPALVRGDPVRLRQIIVNLFKNAVKFTREGGICLRLRRVDGLGSPSQSEPRSDALMRFEVADTGPGVPEELRGKLFTPFFQGDFDQARKAGGTGLGLAISRHLVQLMGGTIGLAPRDEESGSVFWFEIPLEAPEYSSPPRQGAASAGERILVVDDHEGARDFAARVAAAAGYRVAVASSGEAALELLHEAAAARDPFALCLVDLNMPRMDGWRLASEITGDTAINSSRLVLMAPTGIMGAEAKMKLLRWFNGYISKPVRPPELLEALAKTLSADVDLEAAEPEDKGRAEPEERFEGTVLVAEDHEVNRELFTLLLTRLGCKVINARDGMEAVEIGAARRFDLILMDLFMPRMDGYEATRVIRDRGFRGPIIAVTASALKGEREKCLAAGMDDILVKPFKKKDLVAVLAARLPSSAPPGAAPPREAPEAAGGGAPAGEGPGLDAFDWEGVLDTFLGQRDTVVGLLGRFIDKAREQAKALGEASAAGDLGRFRDIAHSLKGASWNLSAKRLGDAALAAEDAGRAGDQAAAAAALELVRKAYAEFAAAVEVHLKT
jgi:PAS domain S-box-containing protein